MSYKINKTNEEWRAQLTPEEYRILREAGTERPGTGKYNMHEEEGTYSCAGCGFELFESEHKFHSGCGWPSFWGELNSANIEHKKDTSHSMIRTELLCSNCGGHLGHIFNDGPPPSGQRYCINSVSLKFKSKQTKIHTLDLKFLREKNTIASYLIETEKGPVLIETGPHSTYPQLKSEIQKAGFEPEDIKHVFLTHIHLDHAGAAWVFAEHGANIYVHPKGARHLASPEKLMSSAKRIYLDKMDMLWGQMNPIPENQVIPVEDNIELTFGSTTIKGWYTPGHAVHHIAWQMGEKLFAGDVAGCRINKGIVVPPCPPPDINIEDWESSIQLIRKMNIKEIYLTHYGKIEDIDAHLSELEKRLRGWANWMKPHFDKGTSPQEITPLFTAFAAQELRDFGIDEEGVRQYEAANPSWMSVAGLLRYWKKKTQTES